MNVINYNKKLFCALVENLNSNHIRYAIIGDYLNLPESIGHDIDIWTDDVKGFRCILRNAIYQNGYRILIDNQTANGCNVVFYKRNENAIILMKIDVLLDTSYKSVFPLVKVTSIARNVIPYKNFYVVNPECEAISHFLYPLFEWGKIKKDSYKVDIKKYCNSEIFKKSIGELWGGQRV